MTVTVWLNSDRSAGKVRCPNPSCRRWFDVSPEQIKGTKPTKCLDCKTEFTANLADTGTIVSDEDFKKLSSEKGFTSKPVAAATEAPEHVVQPTSGRPQ